jgi:hypothetical protein
MQVFYSVSIYAGYPFILNYFSSGHRVKYIIGLNMKKQTRSILQELNSFSANRDVELVIESRALHVINSAINILDMVKENFDQETALDLERRLLNSIRGSDPDKFRRGIRKIQESKRANSRLSKLDSLPNID